MKFHALVLQRGAALRGEGIGLIAWESAAGEVTPHKTVATLPSSRSSVTLCHNISAVFRAM